MIISWNKLENILGVDMRAHRVKTVFNNSKNRNLAALALQIMFHPYKVMYHEESQQPITLKGHFKDSAYNAKEHSMFYSVSNHTFDILDNSRFTSILNIDEAQMVTSPSNNERIAPLDFITVYAQPIFPGFAKISVTPSALGLITPFKNDQILKTLEVLGRTIRGIQSNIPFDLESLKEKLIKEADLESWKKSSPQDRQKQMKTIN